MSTTASNTNKVLTTKQADAKLTDNLAKMIEYLT